MATFSLHARRLAAAATGVLLLTGMLGLQPAGPVAGAAAASRWAPVSTAKIRPGVQMFTNGGQCTANFVFTDDNRKVYVGYAAHCAGTGSASDTNGCRTPSVPLGTTVRFGTGATLLTDAQTVGYGKLVYSSWITMRKRGTRNVNACAYNDFALVKVNKAYVGTVNPTMPRWGGPTGLATTLATGSRVYTVGNSSLLLGSASGRTATVRGTYGDGWSHDVYSLPPGVPGDSGSGYLDASGRAVGVLSTIQLAPVPGTNGVGNLYRELRFAQKHSGIPGLRLVKGTTGFSR